MGTRLTGFMGRMGLTGFSGLRGLRCAYLSFIIYHLLFIISLPIFTSCSSDSGDEEEMVKGTTPMEFEIQGYVSWFDEEVAKTRAEGTNGAQGAQGGATTRAWEIPSGYRAYEDGDQAIGICFTMDGENPETEKKIGYFFKSSGKWRTDIDITETATYYLYGYIPHTPGVTCQVTDLDGSNAKYSEGAKLMLKDVPAVTLGDLCVVIGAKHGFDKEHDGDYTDMNSNTTYDEGVDTRTNRLQRGNFAYNAKPVKDGSGEATANNFVFLLFDHLYSALRVSMRVHGTYNALRTIKLKKLELMTQVDDTPSKEFNNITIKLTANDTGANPITDEETDIEYTQTGNDIDGGLEFWSSKNGEELSTDYSTHIGYFMPVGINTLVLTSTYDVYDKQGNLIRQDCKATNKMVIEELFSDQEFTRRGCRYTINMTIQPTYLYMLSEPDLDNPEVVIN